MGTPAPRIVCAAVTSLSDQLTIDLEPTLCRQSTHSTSRLLLQDVGSIFLSPSIWHPLFQVVRSTVCSPPYFASGCLSDVEVVALLLLRRFKMSFAMESVMSGYSQKMLLKLKVLMHKEQFCDVEIIVQVAPSLFFRL